MSLLTSVSAPKLATLRYYQRDAIDAIHKQLAEVRSTLIVMATGLGKTVTFGGLIAEWPGNVLVLAHRDELIEQNRRSVESITGEWVEVEQAERRAQLTTRIVVGSVQTMCQEHRLERFGRDHFSLIVVDEAHHAPAASYKKILDFFSAKVLGVTATPDRADERAMGQRFDSVAYVLDIEDGIDSGYLVPIRGHREELKEIDLSGVNVSAGDLQVGQLDEAMVKAVEGIVYKTRELHPDRQAVCFFPGIQSALLAAERFNKLDPDSAIFVHAGTDPNERKSMVSRFRRLEHRYFCNVGIATEGFDAPDVSLIVMGRPTKSRSLYAQMAGRGTRVLPHVIDHLVGADVAELRRQSIASSMKPDCMILDFVGNSGKHSLVGIEDILGGKYSQEEVELAKKKTGENPGVNPRDALAAARLQMQAMAAAIKASKVKSQGAAFNPFSVFGLDSEEPDRYARRFGFKAMTARQRETLINAGFQGKELEGMSIGAASKAIEQRRKRIDKGLASVKQMRWLGQHGVTDPAITFMRASAGIDFIVRSGNGKRGAIDPHQLHQILYARVPGEEG